ncbi:VENN motif pre-toxin domain-containing protein, partial [Pelistega sp. NLN82]
MLYNTNQKISYIKGKGFVAASGSNYGGGIETTAHIIADKLYQKSPENLTEQEKETVSALSQVVAGLSGVAVGDNFQSAVVSSEIGKRAVENNYLTIYKVE